MFKANYLEFDQFDLFMFDWIDLEFDQGDLIFDQDYLEFDQGDLKFDQDDLKFDQDDLEFDHGDLPTFYLLLAAQDSETNQSLKD